MIFEETKKEKEKEIIETCSTSSSSLFAAPIISFKSILLFCENEKYLAERLNHCLNPDL